MQADREARKGARTLPGASSPREGLEGRNAILDERRRRKEDDLVKEERRRAREAEDARIAAENTPRHRAARAAQEAAQADERRRQEADRLRREAQELRDRKARKRSREVGMLGYGDPEPELLEARERFNMKLQKRADRKEGEPSSIRSTLGAVAGTLGRLMPTTKKPTTAKVQDEDAALEVRVEEGQVLSLPGGGVIKAPPVRKVVAKPSVTVGKGKSARTLVVDDSDPAALEAAARQQPDYSDAVATNPFHPLNNAPAADGLAPEGHSAVREAMRKGRADGEALPVAGPVRATRAADGSVMVGGGTTIRSAMDATVGVLASSGVVATRAANAIPTRAGGEDRGAAVSRAVQAQSTALRRLADLGRTDLVPNAAQRDSDEESFDDS